MKPILNACCCGCRLETGGKIIAGLYIFFGILGVFGGAALTILVLTSNDISDDPLWNEDMKTYFVIVGIVLAVGSLLDVGAGILAITGINQKKHNRLILMLVIMVFGVIGSILNVIQTDAVSIVSAIITAGIQIYLFLVVFSLFHKIKNESENINNPQWNNSQQPLSQYPPYYTTQQQQNPPQYFQPNPQQYSTPYHTGQPQYQVQQQQYSIQQSQYPAQQNPS